MEVHLYTIAMGPVNEIILSDFGAPSDREAAEVVSPDGVKRAVVLEPVRRSGNAEGWDEEGWRRSVRSAVSMIFLGKPVEIRWDPDAPRKVV